MENQPIYYKGYKISYSLGYWYPDVNGNIERKDIKDVTDWIDNVYIFSKIALGKIGVPIEWMSLLDR